MQLLAVPALALALTLSLGGVATSQCRSGGALLGQGLWEHLLREVKHLTEVLDALVGEGVVMPLPAVDLRQVVAGSQRSQHHHDMKVGDVFQLVVLARLVVFLHNHDTFLEEVLQNGPAGLLGNQHHVLVK